MDNPLIQGQRFILTKGSAGIENSTNCAKSSSSNRDVICDVYDVIVQPPHEKLTVDYLKARESLLSVFSVKQRMS